MTSIHNTLARYAQAQHLYLVNGELRTEFRVGEPPNTDASTAEVMYKFLQEKKGQMDSSDVPSLDRIRKLYSSQSSGDSAKLSEFIVTQIAIIALKQTINRDNVLELHAQPDLTQECERFLITHLDGDVKRIFEFAQRIGHTKLCHACLVEIHNRELGTTIPESLKPASAVLEQLCRADGKVVSINDEGNVCLKYSWIIEDEELELLKQLDRLVEWEMSLPRRNVLEEFITNFSKLRGFSCGKFFERQKELEQYLKLFAESNEDKSKPVLRQLCLYEAANDIGIRPLDPEDSFLRKAHIDSCFGRFPGIVLTIRRSTQVLVLAPEAKTVKFENDDYIQGIYAPKAETVIATNCSKLVNFAVDSAKRINFHGSPIREFYAPEAKEIDVSNCTQLEALNAPNAITINAQGCSKLKKIVAPNAVTVDATRCGVLKQLSAPMAKNVTVDYCEILEELETSVASTVSANSCKTLRKLSAPIAKTVSANDCYSIEEFYAPFAEMVALIRCGLRSISAPMAKRLVFRDSRTVVAVDAPEAETIIANYCTNLIRLNAPKSKSLEAIDCFSLEELDVPVAETLDVTHCKKLRRLNAPKTSKVAANSCLSLKELKLPKVEMLDLSYCDEMERIYAISAQGNIVVSALPKLKEIIAPFAKEIVIRASNIDPVIDGPKAIFDYRIL